MIIEQKMYTLVAHGTKH